MMNEEILLAYTKFTKERIEDVLDINPAEQSAQGMGRRPKFLSGEFLALRNDRHAAPQ